MSLKSHKTLLRLMVMLSALMFTACSGGGQKSVEATPVPGAIFVDAADVMGEISPYIYGSNYGPWVVVSADMLEAAYDSGITILRYPGGEWGDQNDIRSYQADALMDLVGKMGATASINVRVVDGTPEKAAELVRYFNIENDYDIQFWTIGNEPQFYEDYDTERFNTQWRELAEAMRAVDPDITIIGPEVTLWDGNPETDPKDDQGRDWVREFLIANGDIVDVVSIHRYPFPSNFNSPPATVDELRRNTAEWDTILPNLRAVILELTGRDIPIAVTEFNSHWTHAIGGDGTPDSFYNAIWLTDVLGRMINNDVMIVNQFIFTSKNDQGGYGLMGNSEPRPSYYTYQMYKHFGSQRVNASSDEEYVTVYSALREDGTLTVIVINMTDDPVTKPLQLINFEHTGTAEVWRLDPEHNAEQVDDITLTDMTELALPAQSVTLYVIAPAQ